MKPGLINLKILLPSHTLAEKKGITRLLAESPAGAFRIEPHQCNCVVALMPGLLTYETEAEGENHVAIDQGVLIKAGTDVLVSVRDAIQGTDPDKLRIEAGRHFIILDEREKGIRSILTDMAKDLTRSCVTFPPDPRDEATSILTPSNLDGKTREPR